MNAPINERIVCKECMDDKRNRWQTKNKDLKLVPGMFVKKSFTDGEEVEHMWLLLTSVDGNKLVGALNNDPVYLKNVKCDDIITFDRSEVEEHIITELQG